LGGLFLSKVSRNRLARRNVRSIHNSDFCRVTKLIRTLSPQAEQVRFQSHDGAKGSQLNATLLILRCIKEAVIVLGSLASRVVFVLGQHLSKYCQRSAGLRIVHRFYARKATTRPLHERRPLQENGEIMTQYLVAIYLPDDYDPSTEDEAMPRDVDALNDEMEAAGARMGAARW